MKTRNILSILALVSTSLIAEVSFARPVIPIVSIPGGGIGDVVVMPEERIEPTINVTATSASTPSLRVDYSCGKGRNTLYRTKAEVFAGVTSALRVSPIKVNRTTTIEIEPCQTLYFDTGLEANTTYCYRLEAVDNADIHSAESCMKTPFKRVEFKQAHMDMQESEDVLSKFSWLQTDPISEKTIGFKEPYLYHMNILIETEENMEDLKHVGIHVQATPIFNDELSEWSGSSVQGILDGEILGSWVFAIVPGAMYNEIRRHSIDAIINHETPPVAAMIFRKIPVANASENYNDKHQLAYRYLGENGLEFNGISSKGSCRDLNGTEVCSQAILGHFIRKFTDYAYSVGESLVDGIRSGIGSYKRLVNGEISLSLQLHLLNTDSAFGLDRYMHSGWRNEELFLEGVTVHVRQGLASFFGTTNGDGITRIDVAKNQDTKICIQAENRYARLTSFIGRTIVCVADIGKLTSDTSQSIDARNSRLNVLAQFTDTAQYMKIIGQHDMKKITVLTGGWADTFAVEDRAFAPCMGRYPSLIGAYADLLGLVNPLLLIPSAVGEFLSAYDIVLPSNDLSSRGVATHEYGHAIMCDMLISESMFAFQSVWTDVILASASQTADDHASVIAEAFADFITSQVIGGTNYFDTEGSKSHGSISYCDAFSGIGSESCLEYNYAASETISPTERERFTDSIRHLTSIMHDAFDGHIDPLQPNDASHWSDQFDGITLLPDAVSNTTDAYDDDINLEGAALKSLFANWVQDGAGTAKIDFINSLLKTMSDYGYSNFDQCNLINSHNSSVVNICAEEFVSNAN